LLEPDARMYYRERNTGYGRHGPENDDPVHRRNGGGFRSAFIKLDTNLIAKRPDSPVRQALGNVPSVNDTIRPFADKVVSLLSIKHPPIL
jgi:hypothetical protein